MPTIPPTTTPESWWTVWNRRCRSWPRCWAAAVVLSGDADPGVFYHRTSEGLYLELVEMGRGGPGLAHYLNSPSADQLPLRYLVRRVTAGWQKIAKRPWAVESLTLS